MLAIDLNYENGPVNFYVINFYLYQESNMLPKLNFLSKQNYLPVLMKSHFSKNYHREVSNFRKHNKTTKPNHFIGNHRVLDEIKTINAISKPSHRIWKRNIKSETEKTSENASGKISFSHRAVAVQTFHPGYSIAKEREKQLEINKLTNYFAPKVHKLNPAQISQSIIIRSKLAKLYPKKDLQPKLYPRSSIMMQKHLRLVKPCENFTKKYNKDKILDSQKKIPLPPENLKNWSSSTFTKTRTSENIPWSKSGFLEQAIKMVSLKQGPTKEIMNPINNLIKHAKNLAKAMKSK